MTDEPRKPEPEFSFDNMEVQDTSIPLEFPSLSPDIADIVSSRPNPKAEKRKWWQSKPKAEKKDTKAKARKPMPTVPTGGLKTPIANIYLGIGMGLMPINATIAKSVIDSADSCADAWVEYAKTNPAVKRFLIQLCAASAAGALLAAHLPILLSVMISLPAFQKHQGAMLAEMAERFANSGVPQEKDES